MMLSVNYVQFLIRLNMLEENNMPNKLAKKRKYNRIKKNEQLKRDGRTPSQIARKKKKAK